MTTLLTERLQLRPYKATEAALIHSIISDLRVIFWRKEPGTLAEAEKILATSMKRHEESGMGFWGVFERETATFIGQLILQPLPETGEPEIGYHFKVESQGKGYATEAARKLLDHGFSDLSLPRIVAVVLPDNEPSQAVMKKLGLPYVKDLMKGGMLHNYFALDRADYAARHQVSA
ncbi:MAG: GNAT family N-acetyltransferase [Rhodobiaceae bacterium]|nr:GNAT family N-acetyltransferase [Rhodobiaceae bacterium]PCJ71353.1 MAG: GNAT family N-acetyltransferase [Rhodobiaceae bacterium]